MMVRIALTILLSLALVSDSPAENPVTEEWVARYNTFTSRTDTAYAMAVDGSGNIYLAGGVLTLKYGAGGNLIWQVRNHGPGPAYIGMHAGAIAVDPQGNVYIAGSSRGAFGDNDLTTAKYDASGNRLWVVSYNGPANGEDNANAIALDASGNIYVTGYSTGQGTYTDLTTIKYDTDGNQLWVVRYNGPGNGPDEARAIAVDGSGHVLVAGAGYTTISNSDFLVIKYDGAGNELWVAWYDGGSFDFGAVDVALDNQGHIHVVGNSYGVGTLSDIVALKYDPAGNLLWAARHDGPVHSYDEARSIATDAAGNVFVAGYVTTASGSDIVTLKYDGSGNRLWLAQTSGGRGLAHALVVDPAGNVYVAGQIAGGGVDSAITTLKYDAQGTPLWVAHYPGDGDASGLALDAAGNLLVTGNLRVRPLPVESYDDWDIIILKYDPDGNRIWLASRAAEAVSHDQAVALVADDSGNVFVAGSGTPGEDLGQDSDIVVIKYDGDGTPVWTVRYDEPAGSYDQAVAVAVDGSGNVYVTGFSIGEGSITQGGNYDIITIKFNPAGNRLWSARYDGPAASYDNAAGLAVDATGNIYVAGVSIGSGTSRDMATIKYDTAGNRIWVSRYNGSANGSDSAAALALDSSGNVYVTGTSDGGVSDSDIVIVKYDSAGNQLWAARYDGPTNMRDGAKAVALDPSGNVYVLGYSGAIPIRSSLFRPSLLLLKLDPAGNLLWAKTYGGADTPVGLIVDGAGSAYLTGSMTHYNAPEKSFSALKYSTSGSLLWSAVSTGLENRGASAAGLAVDSSGNVYVAGTSDGGGTNSEIFTLAYDTDGGPLWSAGYNGPYDRIDAAAAVILDSSGNVLVAGRSEGDGTGFDFVTIKYRQAGSQGSDGGGDSGGGNGGGGCFITTARDSF